MLLALREAGYDTGPSLPADGQELIEDADRRLGAGPRVRHRRGDPPQSPAGSTPLNWNAGYRHAPNQHESGSTRTWRAGSVSDRSAGAPIGGLLLGNIFIGIQPSRGYDQDPAAVYHSPDLPPPPYYVAFYRWLRSVFAADAVIHLGKHGNLEWLPGKGSALSADCFPEVVLQDLPNIYPFIINNPGEGAQAKRRSAAVIVDHLIPPMTRADTYGDLRQLELLLDELLHGAGPRSEQGAAGAGADRPAG